MPERTSLRILLVEDDPQDRALIIRELQRQFAEVQMEVATDADTLGRLLAEAVFDAVVTDYQLRWSDGLEVLRRVKTQCPHCPVVMFTGSGSQEIAVEAMKSGLDDYLVKAPHHYVRLPVAIQTALLREEQRRRVEQAEQARGRLVVELQERDRHKDEFLAMLGHELRNPLGVARNALYLLSERAPGDGRDAQLRERAMRQLDQLGRLVDDLLDVARVTRGQIELRVQRLDLSALIREVTENLRSRIEPSHTLTLALPDQPVWVRGDATRLEQVFSNLLDNAVKYTPSRGRISVALRSEGDAAVARVADTGIGISADALPRLFEIFTTVGRSITQTHGGLGIGLYLCHSLLKLHGGELEARSTGEGHGSEFIVRLPLCGGTGDTAGSEADPGS